jgi:hypothetical protein
MEEEKREHARLTMHATVNIQHGDRRIEAELENFSVKGTFVRGRMAMELDDVVVFSICQTAFRAQAKVVRKSADGYALHFEKYLPYQGFKGLAPG